MQIIENDGTQRELEQFELDALAQARAAYDAEREKEGIFVQYDSDEALSALLAVVVNQVDVPIEQAVRMRGYYPEWSADAHYEPGFRVRYAESLWTCLQAHAAQADWTPFAAPSLWAKVLIEDVTGENPPEWEQPSSTNPYNQGDRVTFNGKVYVSLIANNTWSPADYPAGWQEVE